MDMPKVSIIILNWNGWEDTIECLESLYQITYPNYEVIVVDNGSKDSSVKKIKEYCHGQMKVQSKFFIYNPNNKPIKIIEYTREEAEAGGDKEREFENAPSNKKLTIIKNEKNYGYAEGNNIGIRYALARKYKYVLILNNDTVVHPNVLRPLVTIAERNPSIGGLTPKILFYPDPKRIYFAGGRLNSYRTRSAMYGYGKLDGPQFQKTSLTGNLTGAAMLIPSRIFMEVGLFDPQFFLIGEDTDLVTRIIESGYRLIYVPESVVFHKGSASFGGHGSPLSQFFIYRNKIIYARKHCDTVRFAAFLILLGLWRLPTFIAFCLVTGKRNNVRAAMRGLLWHLRPEGRIPDNQMITLLKE